MQPTVLLRCSHGSPPGEAWLSPDAGHGAPQHSALCGELRRQRQTVRPSAPQSELQPGLVDLTAPPRKTVFWHEPNKRHVPFSSRRSGHKPRNRQFGECLRTVPGTCNHTPLHRQSVILEKDIAMVAAMRRELISGTYIQADEIPVDVQTREGRGKDHQAYLWQYGRPGGSVVFDFRLGRGRDEPKRDQQLADFEDPAVQRCSADFQADSACRNLLFSAHPETSTQTVSLEQVCCSNAYESTRSS
jgi:hypothetical protein